MYGVESLCVGGARGGGVRGHRCDVIKNNLANSVLFISKVYRVKSWRYWNNIRQSLVRYTGKSITNCLGKVEAETSYSTRYVSLVIIS